MQITPSQSCIITYCSIIPADALTCEQHFNVVPNGERGNLQLLQQLYEPKYLFL